MKKAKRMLSLLLLVAMLLPMLPVTALTAFAQEMGKEDAMKEIKADEALDAYRVGDTQRFDDDGYIGIPYEITVYYDAATHGNAKTGYVTLGATPLILYVVNANVERIGTESDTDIIKTMLDRGFAVAVLDYLNSEKAKSPALDFSAQLLRSKLASGDFFADKSIFPEGTYADHLIVPAGYNVRYNDVFMELDKHGTDGTLDRIVNVWNNDFRLYHKDVIVKWVHSDGTRKATQNGFDGTAPVWYSDKSGKNVDAQGGVYTKVQYTLAETVTDCVKADGTPIDLNLYIHVLYPTAPEKAVPVMTMFSSSGYLINGSSNVARPQMQGFLFDGYAGVLFDYAWVPMGKNDHYGYFDGSSGSKSVTGDNQSYATYTYNAAQVATAAMRYTRYLALSEPETYAFDTEALGVFGISKAAWMTQLGAPLLRENLYTPADGSAEEVAELVNDKINGFYQQLWLPEHHGETRYDNGLTDSYTVDGFTVDGGELQPWAVWNGYEISSGAQMVYSSCGASVDYFCEGYSPQFITENLQDNYNTEYGKQNEMVSLCRNHNIPALWYEADIAHTFAVGFDWKYGVDIYDAFHEFADYYLKGDAVKVTYTDPKRGAVITATDTITVKLIGDATAEEISKITVADSKGNAVTGTWTSAYGDTEWTLIPDALTGGESYTLTVPADFTGKSGKAMGTEYTTNFYVRAEGEVASLAGADTVDENGAFVNVTVPSFENASGFALRVRVTNDASNLLCAYDAETGALLGSVRVSGIGSYEIDLTDALAAYGEGTDVRILLRTANAQGDVKTYSESFDEGRGDFTTSSYVSYENAQSIAGETALKVTKKTNYGKFDGDYWFYERGTVITNKKLINGGSAVTRDDMGRRFVFKIRLYDTVSRRIGFQLNSATSKNDKTLDFDRVIYTEGTVANEWCEYEIPYTVYEIDYGFKHVKSFTMQMNATGDTEMPLYVDQFDVYEIFTDVATSSVSLVSKKDSENAVKAPASENAFSVKGNEYATWKDAMNAAASGDTVTLLRSYVFTDADAVNIGTKTALTVDLNGYRLSAENTSRALLTVAATDTKDTSVVLKNGSVVLGAMPLAGWDGSSSAGNGKRVHLALENVYLSAGRDFTALSFLVSESITSGVNVDCDVSFTDSTVDIDRYQLPDRAVTLFGAGEGGLSVTYTFKGGKLYLNDVHELTVSEAIVNTLANGEGEYLKVLVPASEGAPVLAFRKEDTFAMPAATALEGGYVVFEPGEVKDATEYGAIPEKYADKALYPFVVFADDLCIGADANFNAATCRANEYMEVKNGSTVQILLRRNFHLSDKGSEKLWKLKGHLVVDLGGYAITRSNTVFEGMVEEDYATAFDTALTVKNGTFLSANGHVIAFESNGKAVKNYDIRFENITFAVASGNEPAFLVSRCWGGNGKDVNVDMTLVDCTFDFSGAAPDSKVPTKALTVFQMTNTLVKANIRVEGGKILADGASPANVTWSSLNGDDTLFFEPDENGNYVTLTVPNGVIPSHALPTADGLLPFSTLVTDGDAKDVWMLTNKTVKTEYGSIPAEYSGNVFALFMDGAFVGAVDTWSNAQSLVRTTLDQNVGKTVTVLMRAEHTHDANISEVNRIPFMKGNVVVDLGGHVLTASKTVLECGTKNYTGSFDTSYTLKNGTVNVRGGNFFATESRSNSDKNIDLSFVDVTVNVEGSAKTTLFVTYGDQTAYTGKINLDILFEGCSLELGGYTGGSFLLSSIATSKANVNATFTFAGGEIVADELETLTLNTPVRFAADKNGAYTALKLPASAPLADLGGVKENGVGVMFAGGVTSGEYTVYTLTENARATEYGIIPSEYASAQDNPFVLFTKAGTFHAAKTTWNAAVSAAHSYLSSNRGAACAILVRVDYTGKDSTTYLGRMTGSIVIDLGGHTMGRMNNSWLEGGTKGMTETEAGYEANVTVKNGRLLSGRADNTGANAWLVTYQTYVNYNKTVNLTFDGVTFAVVAGQGSLNALVAGSWGPNSSATGILTSTVTFRNCDFDFTGSTGTVVPSSTRLVKLDQAGDYLDIKVVFEGGRVLGSATGITLASVSANDTVTFVKNADGKYFAFDVTTGSPSSSTAYDTDAGKMYFTRESFATVDGKRHYYYELGVKSNDCDGVIVPYMYYFNPQKYPYIIVQNGAFIGAREDWRGATALAIAYIDNAGDEDAVTTLYLVRDVTDKTSGTYLSPIRGKMIVDLGGYTLTTNQTLFEAEGRHAHTSTVEVRDGTIVINRTGNGSIIAFNRDASKGDGTFGSDASKEIYLTFDGVTFRYADGATSANPLVVTWGGKEESGHLTGYMTFNDCIFDMRASAVKFNLFHVAQGGDNIDVITEINGGEFLLPAMNLVTWYKTDGTKDTLTLGKYNGAYPTLAFASGNVPTSPFATAEGDGYYYNGGAGKYLLGIGRAKITGASLNIGVDLSMNYFVRIHDASLTADELLMQFRMAGKQVTVSEYVLKNGEYVFVLTGIAPQQIGDKIDATLLLGDTVINEKLGYSVKENLLSLYAKDAEALKMSAEKYAAMKSLIADLLVYGDAAQDYTGYAPDAPVLDGTEEILPSTVTPDEGEQMTLSGNGNSELRFKSATVHFATVNEIRVRIFVGDVDASLVRVTVDGTAYRLADLQSLGNGIYLVAVGGIRATALDTVHSVELSLDGAVCASLSYSVNAYAYTMQESENASMRALALALYRYGASADAYAAIA